MTDYTFAIYDLTAINTSGNPFTFDGSTMVGEMTVSESNDDTFHDILGHYYTSTSTAAGSDDPDGRSDQLVSSNTLDASWNGTAIYSGNHDLLTGDDGSEITVFQLYSTDGSTIPNSAMLFAATAPLQDGVQYTHSAPVQGTAGSGGVASSGAVLYSDLAQWCFTRDTMIDTDQGEVAVQDLEVGMMVRTRDNGMQPIRWIGMSPTKDRAVRIKAGAMGNTRDLVVSPRHRMVLDGWQLEMLFDHDHALVTAVELVNDDTIVRDEMADVEYYHVMFDQHEVIYAEGAATESFHPDQASMGAMDAAARAEIFALFPDLRNGNARAETAPSLSVTQAAYVAKNMDAFVG